MTKLLYTGTRWLVSPMKRLYDWKIIGGDLQVLRGLAALTPRSIMIVALSMVVVGPIASQVVNANASWRFGIWSSCNIIRISMENLLLYLRRILIQAWVLSVLPWLYRARNQFLIQIYSEESLITSLPLLTLATAKMPGPIHRYA